MLNNQTIDNNVEQGIASYIDYINNMRLSDLMTTIDIILTSETDKLSELSIKSANALSHLDWAKMEIDNLIDINRGGNNGIHGFISEFAETGIRNARDTYQGLQESVVLLNDNGLADILLQDKEVQMKFYANILNGINQSVKYDELIMLFPKDHVDVIEKIMDGAKTIEYNGNTLSNSQIFTIKKAIENESTRRGVSYEEWLESSVLKYKEVQKGNIDQTLSREAADIKRQTAQQEDNIQQDAERDRLIAQQKAQPSFAEATKVAGVGASVQGGLNLGIFIYQKHKVGKEVWDFDAEDWKECGATTATGAFKGGISGYAIYGLTNICHLSAPSAGAITSGTFGLINAIIKYRKKDIDMDGFIDLVTFNAIDASGAAIGASIGQTIIPIPVVGALIGSIVTTTTLNLGKGILNNHEIEIIKYYQEQINALVDELDKEYQIKLDELLIRYHSLGEFQRYSFDININMQLRLITSIKLARAVGIPEKSILKNIEEVDKYFLV